MARDRLNREIIKKIMQNVGVVSHPHFGKAGLTSSDLLIDKKLSLKDEFGKITHHKIYAGEIKLESPISVIKGLVADISDEEMSEFIVLFRMDSYPIYALRLIFDEVDNGLFLNSQDEEFKWYEADVYNKAQALAGMERIADSGIQWNHCENHDDLYKGLLLIAGLDEA